MEVIIYFIIKILAFLFCDGFKANTIFKSPLRTTGVQAYDGTTKFRPSTVYTSVPNVLKFDILLPEIVFSNSTGFFLDILDFLSILRNLDEIMIWFDKKQLNNNFFLNNNNILQERLGFTILRWTLLENIRNKRTTKINKIW